MIGVGAAREPASWAVWELPAALVASNYLEAIETAGGIPLLVPPSEIVRRHPDVVLERVDGLLLVGGPDLDPATYGASPSPGIEETMPARDAPEIALVRRARDLGIPVLGICRGMQIINVAFGGSLAQHLPSQVGHEEHRRQLGSFHGNEHEVCFARSSTVARIEGGERIVVHSHHHQAVESVGEGLEITGRAHDGVAEALEGMAEADGEYLVGVQWHPEADPDSRVIASLVRAAAIRAARDSEIP
jgi:putative glutamine amidotransferase